MLWKEKERNSLHINSLLKFISYSSSYPVIWIISEEMIPEQGKDSDDQEEDDNNVKNGTKRMQSMTKCSVKKQSSLSCDSKMNRLPVLPSNCVAKVIIDQEDRTKGSNDSIICSKHDEDEESIDKHHEDAGYFDDCSWMCDK